MATPTIVFSQTKALWTDRVSKKIECPGSLAAIESLVKSTLKAAEFFPIGMDFGSGRGRFLPLFDNFCGHMYASDIVMNAVEQAAATLKTSSGVYLSWPPVIPWLKPRIDLLWSFFTFQHIIDDGMFETYAGELLRVMKPGCRVLMVETATELNWHTKARSAQVLARVLGLRADYKAERVAVVTERKDHWFIDGIRG